MLEDDPLEPDPYAALDVPRDATPATIRSVYRKLVLTCHPDKVKEESERQAAAERFHRVQQAYELLSDEKRRQTWDARAKKAALEAETQKLRAQRRPKPPSKSASMNAVPTAAGYASSRSYYASAADKREDILYEERATKDARAYEEDYFSAKFAEVRSTNRFFDPRFTTGMPSPRRTSVQVPDDFGGIHTAEIIARQERKARERKMREREAMMREEKTRQRDRDRKRDMETKFQSRTFATAESASSDDLDESAQSSYNYIYDNRPPHKEPLGTTKRPSKEPVDRSKSGKKGNDVDSELDRKIYGAMGYIKRHEGNDSDPIPPRRSEKSRAASNADPRTPVNAAGSSAFATATSENTGRGFAGDDGRHSASKGRSSRAVSPDGADSTIPDSDRRKGSSGRTRRAAGNLETQASGPSTPSRQKQEQRGSSHHKSNHSFDPDVTRNAGPPRSATFNIGKDSEIRNPMLRRAETMPIRQSSRQADSTPLKSSNLKPNHSDGISSDDSDSSSEESESDSDLTESDSEYDVKPMSKSAKRPPLRTSTSGRHQSSSSARYEHSSRRESDYRADDYRSSGRAHREDADGHRSSRSSRNVSPNPTFSPSVTGKTQSTPSSGRRNSERPSMPARGAAYSSSRTPPIQSRSTSHIYENGIHASPRPSLSRTTSSARGVPSLRTATASSTRTSGGQMAGMSFSEYVDSPSQSTNHQSSKGSNGKNTAARDSLNGNSFNMHGLSKGLSSGANTSDEQIPSPRSHRRSTSPHHSFEESRHPNQATAHLSSSSSSASKAYRRFAGANVDRDGYPRSQGRRSSGRHHRDEVIV